MGVPVVTLQGNGTLLRAGESIAHNAGLAGWIAADEDDYVAKALHLAARVDELAKLRMDLRAQITASPLFDCPRFAGHFERALRAMWDCRRPL